MESHWAEEIVSVSHFSSAVVVLGPCLGVVLGVTSHFFVGFSSMSASFFLLVTTAWYVQSASSATVCLFVFPLTDERRSRFPKFFPFLPWQCLSLTVYRKKSSEKLAVACLVTNYCSNFSNLSNFIVISIFSVRFNGDISILPSWNQHSCMYLTLWAMELVIAAIDSFIWTLPPLNFGIF